MKYLLLLSVLFLSTCSSESVEEEITEQTYEYFVLLEDDCRSGNDNKWEIKERTYEAIINVNKELPSCDSYFTIPDINDIEREGYMSGLKTEDPKYEQLP